MAGAQAVLAKSEAFLPKECHSYRPVEGTEGTQA